jgi:hypothetical protein
MLPESREMKVSFDSKAFERDLSKSISDCNEFMAKNCATEPFDGFAMQVGMDFANFGVYYNTEMLYQECLKGYLKGEFGELYRKDKDKRWQLRWSPGDWPYSSYWPKPAELAGLMNDMERWGDDAQRRMMGGRHSSEEWDEYGLKLFQSAGRVLAKLEKDGAFNALPRTKEFRIMLTDHDELSIYSYLRYERFQKDGTVLLPNNGRAAQIDADAERKMVLAKFKG